MSINKYIVATKGSWNIKQYQALLSKKKRVWHLITKPKDLNLKKLKIIKPRYIFFPHWSHKVEKKITDQFECVCFHETNLPYGRGGTPIQNLIQRGHKKTVITALKMIEKFDAGPIYMKRSLSLHGVAQDIYERSAKIIFKMIRQIVNREPMPVSQKGKVTIFKRRTKKQSVVSKKFKKISDLYNHIRMLDAETYPPAFINHGKFVIEFSSPKFLNNKIKSEVNIKLGSKEKK